VTISKAVIASGAVLLSAAALWSQQTNDALLRVHSFPGAVAEVLFWGLPALVVYVLVARRPTAVFLLGAVLVVSLVAQWWSSATDRHSTASLGPGLLGWFALPALFGLWWLVPRLVREWNSGLVSTPAKVFLLIPATVVLVLLGPIGIAVAALLWLLAFSARPSPKDVDNSP
jgi:hypothetical protein